MAKAKVGDLVRVTHASISDRYTVGNIAEVTHEYSWGVEVEFDFGVTHKNVLEHGDYEILPQEPPKDYAEVTQADRISELCDEVKALLIRKNNDYGDSFGKQFEKRGMLGALIRMEDKLSRLDTLVGGHQAEVDESIDDTLRDLAGYALLTLVERGKSKEGE